MGEPALSMAYAEPVRASSSCEGALALNDAEIRRAVERIPDLSLLEDTLLVRVCGLSLLRGYAWISQEALAKLLRHSVRSVREATARLCELGFLNTVRSYEGLTYLPQWEAIGLSRVGKSDAPAKSAGSDRQNLPVHLRSTISGSTKTESSRARAVRSHAAASLSKASKAQSSRAAVAESELPSELPELGAVLDKFGPEAARDVRDVLSEKPVRQNQVASRAALQRLLVLSPTDIRTSPGACFRGFVRLAVAGRLTTPQAASPSTSQALREPEKPPMDPLVARIKAQRDRLSYLPATHPHRARFASELAELEAQLCERQKAEIGQHALNQPLSGRLKNCGPGRA